ncbi:MAG: preprotein translocase subunit SecY [Ardenticatenales bacterium]|nr:preprotein translocase subunit SecY [Ardenticatenales bacterium]
MLDSLRQSLRLPDLRRRILYTIAILAVYRFAAHVPVPGVNKVALTQLFNATDAGAVGRALSFLDLLSGSALQRFSVMTLGVYPYITASIIMQLLTPLIPSLEELSKEGEAGRNKINMWTYWLTIPLALVQAIAQIALINGQGGTSTGGQVISFGAGQPLNTLAVLVALTAGTYFGLWLGERITEKGIGNGVSILIFAGIVSGMPARMYSVFTESILAFIAVISLTVATVFLIVIVQEGHRRIQVQYGRQMRGQRVYGGQSTYIPLRVNSTGMIPLIFANSLLIFPAVIGGVLSTSSPLDSIGSRIGTFLSLNFDPNAWLYYLVYFILVIVFTFFYTDVVFRQQNLHETLQRNGGFVPGIRPGKRTEDYLTGIMHRITFVGAVFLGVVAVLPFFAGKLTGLSATTSMVMDATGLLIVVGVVLDTIKQLEAQLTMRHYEGFIR